jgi:hypothetical protein
MAFLVSVAKLKRASSDLEKSRNRKSVKLIISKIKSKLQELVYLTKHKYSRTPIKIFLRGLIKGTVTAKVLRLESEERRKTG